MLAACLSVLLVTATALGQTAGPLQTKETFVAGLTQFIDALAGTYGDEGARLTASLGTMQRVLSRWQASTTADEAALAASTGAVDRRRLAEMHRALVVTYLAQHRVDDAHRELTSATRLDPALADAWLLLGMVRSRLALPAQAVHALREAAVLDPRNAATLYLLATELERSGDADGAAGARQVFTEAQRLVLGRPTGAAGRAPPFVQWDLLPQGEDVTPFFAPASYADGFAFLQQGRSDEALDAFERAATADPLVADISPVATRLAQAGAALRRGELSVAVAHVEAVIAARPDHSEARRVLGMAHWAGGRHDDSVAQLEAAIQLNPADERARAALADVLVDAGRLSAAERVLRETIETMPASGQAYYKLGTISSTLKRYPDALWAFEEALRRGPLVGAERIYRLIGELPASLEPDPQATLARLIRRLDLDLNNPRAHLDLGAAYLRQNRADAAATEFLVATLVEPGSAEAYVALGQAWLRMADFDGAATAARRAVALNERHAAARYTLATALTRLGDTDAAQQEFARYRQMLADAQTDRRRDFEIGLLMRDVRESLDRDALDDAIAHLEEAVRLRPDDPALSLSLGVFLMNAGRYPEAVRSLEQAVALNAGPEVHQYLADAYSALGRVNDAQDQRRLFNRRRRAVTPR